MKILTNGHQYTKATEDKKLMSWINVHTPIEKQSNQNWNTPIHLQSNGHIKKSSDLSVFYHDFLLMVLSPIVG